MLKLSDSEKYGNIAVRAKPEYLAGILEYLNTKWKSKGINYPFIIRLTKEMVIRKIQGASVPLIMFLVSNKFLIVLGVASVLGCIGGYYVSNKMMDSIWDYFVTIKPGILLLSVLIMAGATILTIVFKIFRAAKKNPVVSLRYE